MDNRIRSNVARNRSVVNDTAIQSLFIRLTEMHAQVMARMNKLEDQRSPFTLMHLIIISSIIMIRMFKVNIWSSQGQ